MRQDRGGASIAVVAVWECNRSYQDTNRCRGYGFVRFASSEDVKKALEKDHAQLGTRYIEVTYARKRETTPSQPTVVPLDCRSIFVKNLPYDADEEAIKNVFMW